MCETGMFWFMSFLDLPSHMCKNTLDVCSRHFCLTDNLYVRLLVSLHGSVSTWISQHEMLQFLWFLVFSFFSVFSRSLALYVLFILFNVIECYRMWLSEFLYSMNMNKPAVNIKIQNQRNPCYHIYIIHLPWERVMSRWTTFLS